jgi:hypothetical protein
VLFPHEKHIDMMWKMWGKRAKNVVLHVLRVSKICVVFSRYFSCTFLTNNTCGSCTILIRS